jgi:hypothetical protein
MSEKHAKENVSIEEPVKELRSEPSVEMLKEQIQSLGTQLQHSLVTMESLKKRVNDLNFEIVDRDSQIFLMKQEVRRLTPSE